MKPQYEPITSGQKLGYLIEECGEVLAATGKTLRWGPDGYNPELPPAERETNRAWLRRELQDLRRAIEYVEGVVDFMPAALATPSAVGRAQEAAAEGDPLGANGPTAAALRAPAPPTPHES